jgi:hypothetical protein
MTSFRVKDEFSEGGDEGGGGVEVVDDLLLEGRHWRDCLHQDTFPQRRVEVKMN